MTNHTTFHTPNTKMPYYDRLLDDQQFDDACDLVSFDDDAAAPMELPISPFTEDDLRFLRDFILGTAMYVEQLEAIASEQSDEFWQAREHAYRIVTAVLIRHYEYELEG